MTYQTDYINMTYQHNSSKKRLSKLPINTTYQHTTYIKDYQNDLSTQLINPTYQTDYINMTNQHNLSKKTIATRLIKRLTKKTPSTQRSVVFSI